MNAAQKAHNGSKEHVIDVNFPGGLGLDLWPGDRIVYKGQYGDSVWRVCLDGAIVSEDRFNHLYR